MGVIGRLACKLRGGHKWEERSDPAGTVTFCVRCGALQHVVPMAARVPESRSYEKPDGGGPR